MKYFLGIILFHRLRIIKTNLRMNITITKLLLLFRANYVLPCIRSYLTGCYYMVYGLTIDVRGELLCERYIEVQKK